MNPLWVDPARTALLLIDMQVDFARRQGAMGKTGRNLGAVDAAIAQAEMLTEAAREARVPVVFVRLITKPRNETAMLKEWKERRQDHDPPPCLEGSPGAEFVGPRPAPGEYVVSKSRYSGFTGTRLEESLRTMARDTLVIAGLTTECCIAATAFDGFERDFHVVVASDAVAAYDPAQHCQALKALEMNCALLFSAAEIAAAWKTYK